MRAPMINSTKQSIAPQRGKLDCFVASLLAMTTLRGTTPVISIFSLCFILVVARLDRTTQYAAASPWASSLSGILDHPLSRL